VLTEPPCRQRYDDRACRLDGAANVDIDAIRKRFIERITLRASDTTR